ncbi:MBL fold metallo-hydrolase [Tropicimonas isoalkanivorans]|uniref:L-ascorbate metabolism protein UlaG, beta-lactamase superfamily n=1 Tax=Tropicimonas isoalkanivorans TaxID=441112 RepID=A0A1I1ISI6_9RHOB|nr:MBL fold metallo-hydrolase [Tropicimonas isoalkanivorans]SFC39165.1 L-ascorbate metabolism protein UlaG, beta-lactamase superfamily [Tropicimonas isoalkanivorans]
MRFLTCLAAIFVLTTAASAQQDRRPSHCIALVEGTPGLEVIWRAGYRDPVPEDSVRLSYVDHSMYLIQTEGGLDVVTDYNGFLGPSDLLPDVVTMNHSHSTHWTSAPDPAIPHVLQGWDDLGGPAAHHLDLGEMLIRNVTTDIRGRFGGGVEPDGNSIFIFETTGLCIGHLGHLHHEPTPEQYAAIGRLDVVMAPIDGGMTLPLPVMIRVLQQFRASIVLPMHWFSGNSLGIFLDGMAEDFRIDRRQERSFEVSLRTLPSEPTVIVLQPRFLGFNDDGQ